MNERELFIAALQIEDPAAQSAYLGQACGGDVDLRQRVDILLHALGQAGSFLEQPAADAGATSDVPPPGLRVNGAPAEGPGTVIGPYKLLQQIGEGGMGVVWMAEQTQPVQRKVALKVIKPGMDSRQVIARFEAERQALAMMDHVNIARVFDGGATASGRPYFVMELVHGVPITRYCDDNHLTPRERLELFVPVCQAIQHAHQKGIIHRDVKPSNVMITLYDGKPVPKVIDFGVAKATEQKLTERTLFTQYGTMVGTLEYMSPEQAEMSALGVDTRSDIYSLGVLLYELLTGSTPLTHKRMKEAAYAEILRMIKEEEPPRPSARLSDSGEALASISAQRHMEPAKLTKLVRGELDWIVMKCLEKDRNRRYETANGFAADLQRYLNDEQVLACPPSASYRLRKFLRRNKGPVLAAGLVLFALIAGIIGTSLGLVEADKATDQALKSADAERQAKIDAEKAAAAEKLATKKALDTAEANKVLASKEANARLDADERRKKAEILAVQLKFERAFQQPAENRPFSMLSTAALLREAVVLENQQLQDSLRLHLGTWVGQVHRLKSILSDSNIVLAVAFSPDGKTVLTGGWGHSARLWETGTGQPLGPPLQHQGIVSAVAFSPDGKTVLTGSSDKTARLWETGTGKPLGLPIQHQGEVVSVAFSPDGKTLLTGSNDKTAQLWETATAKPLGPPLQHQDMVFRVAFSPDGKTVLTGSNDNTARLWETATGKPLGPPLQHHGFVRAVAFSPDGKTVLTGSFDYTARLWETATGKPIGPPLQHQIFVTAVAFSPDGKTALTGSVDNTARLWETATGKPVGPPLQHQNGVENVTFSPDGRTMLTGSRDKTARLWETATGKPLGPPLQHQGNVGAVAFSPDSKTVLTGSEDMTARLWETAMGQPFGRPLQHQSFVLAVAFSSDGKTVLTGSYDNTARLWETATGQPLGPPLQHQDAVRAVAFSPDGKSVLSGSDDKTARLWETATGKPLGPPLQHQGMVMAVAFSPDGKTVLTASNDNTARLWETATGKPIGPPLQHQREVLAVAFSPDGKTVLTGSNDRTARLWETVTGKPIGPPLQHQGEVLAMAFSPDGKTVLTGCADNTARLWETATGKPLGPPLQHQAYLTAVAYSPDGKTVLTGSEDKTARLWETATGQPLGPPLQHQSTVVAVAFSPDGKTVLTGSNDSTAQLWHVPRLIEGDPERILLWAQVITGLELDEHGGTRGLDAETWQQRRLRLQELGGPPLP